MKKRVCAQAMNGNTQTEHSSRCISAMVLINRNAYRSNRRLFCLSPAVPQTEMKACELSCTGDCLSSARCLAETTAHKQPASRSLFAIWGAHVGLHSHNSGSLAYECLHANALHVVAHSRIQQRRRNFATFTFKKFLFPAS
jgi:hypothetical protein